MAEAGEDRGYDRDGVNDAPALKKADIGVAMGIGGTEVSKDAASMILLDDNFATIIKAVANGRNVYRNIKNAIQFLLSGNMAGIFCVLYTSFRGLPLPFAPVHLLFINLLTDSLPAIAIGMEPAEEDLLRQGPRDPREGILTGDFVRILLVQGGMIGAATMWAYGLGLIAGGPGTASTMAFSTLTLARLFHGFNCRSSRSLLRLGIFTNPYSLAALGWEQLFWGRCSLCRAFRPCLMWKPCGRDWRPQWPAVPFCLPWEFSWGRWGGSFWQGSRLEAGACI